MSTYNLRLVATPVPRSAPPRLPGQVVCTERAKECLHGANRLASAKRHSRSASQLGASESAARGTPARWRPSSLLVLRYRRRRQPAVQALSRHSASSVSNPAPSHACLLATQRSSATCAFFPGVSYERRVTDSVRHCAGAPADSDAANNTAATAAGLTPCGASGGSPTATALARRLT